MRRILVGAVLALCFGRPAEAQDALLSHGAAIAQTLESGGNTHRLRAAAGDLIAVTLAITRTTADAVFLDASDSVVRRYYVPATTSTRVGIVAPANGLYRLHLIPRTPASASYTLRLEVISVADRMRDVHVPVREDYSSDRLTRLASEAPADGAALERFWKEMDERAAPLVEPITGDENHVRVTFVWRQVYDTRNVRLSWGVGRDDYFMSRLPGTDLWYKTLRLHRTSRFPYRISPNFTPDDGVLVAQRDPLNRTPLTDGPAPASLLELDRAPDESWFRREPTTRGRVVRTTWSSSLLKGERRIRVYTPPRYTPDRPYPLLVLFDGEAYAGEYMAGPRTLDNLIGGNRIRPVVVCFVESSGTRGADLGFDDTFGRALATELLPMLRASYAISRASRDVVLGGYSAGGSAAALIALRHSDVIGNVLSQSGAFRGRLPSDAEANHLARTYMAASRVPVRFYLECGYYDHMPNAGHATHEMVLDQTNTQGNRHFRDVLIAKGYDVTYRETGGTHDQMHWRAMLADGLMTLLAPSAASDLVIGTR